MENILEKTSQNKSCDNDKLEMDMKSLALNYIKKGLVAGKIDNEGRTFLSKEEYDEW